MSSAGTGTSRATVSEGVEAKDIKAFMRVNNGVTAGSDFDPDGFVRALEMGTPDRVVRRGGLPTR